MTPLYDKIGGTYSSYRRPDPRIAAAIWAALGDAASVVNVGAGTGSYEPTDRSVIAVEPSETMIKQRSSRASPCLLGAAEALPLDSKSADAAMAILSMHHWSDHARGFAEMARVARKRVILLTWIPNLASFWLTQDYFPQILADDQKMFPAEQGLFGMLKRIVGQVSSQPLPIPHDCEDGLLGAYWRRPRLYLEPLRRRSISSFSRFDASAGLAKLSSDLESGRWAERYGHLMQFHELDLGYRLIICEIKS